MTFPKNYVDPKFSRPRITARAYSQESETGTLSPLNWDEIDDVSEVGPFKEPHNWGAAFEIEMAVPSEECDAINSGDRKTIELVRRMTDRLATLIQSNKVEEVAAALGFAHTNQLVSLAPDLFGEGSGTNITSAMFSRESDVRVECGKHLILAYAEPQKCLVAKSVKFGDTKALITVDFFLFARVQGKWKVALNGSGFMNLNLGGDSEVNLH